MAKITVPPPLEGAAFGAIRLATTPIHLLGFERATRAAQALGTAMPRLAARRFRRAVSNIRDAYPEWDEARVHATAVACYQHLFQLGVEFAYVPRLITHGAVMRHLVFTHIDAPVRALLGSRPVILITGHIGNWELIGYAISMLGFPMHAVYRPLDLAPLDAWVREAREAKGLTLVSKFGAVKTLPPVLKAGNPIGLVADQSGGDRAFFAPFFGRLTSTYKSVALLAMQSQATIVCGVARRLAPGEPAPAGSWQQTIVHDPEARRVAEAHPGLRYSVEAVDVFGPENWESQPDRAYYITARYRRAMEQMVRRSPEQYWWMHRIWRSRPAHERQGKPFPAPLREKLRNLPWMTDQAVQALEDRSARDATDLVRLQRG